MMYQRAIISLVVALLSNMALHAQSIQDTVHLQAAQVAEKQKYQLFSAGIIISALDSQVLKQNYTENLAQLLAMHSPVFIKDYGSGTAATISFRGTNATQTQFTWNGFQINSSSLGELDLSLVPVSLMDNISLLHGGSSSLYGSGAVGGSIHLTNKPEWQTGTSIRFNHESGSFETYRPRIKVVTGTGKFQSVSSGFFNHIKNNFPFVNNALAGSPVVRQQHAAVKQYGGIQSFYFKINERNTLSSGLWYQSSHRQIPPMMTSFISKATQTDSALRTFLGWDRKYKRGNLSLKVAYFDEHLYYQDPVSGVDSYNRQKKYQGEGQFRMFFTERLLFTMGTTYNQVSARVSGYAKEVVNETRCSVFTGLKYEPISGWKTSFTMRKEFSSGYAPPFVPSVGFEGNLLKRCLYLKGNYNHNFNLPTLNQRFWITGGNPDLNPENGRSMELGLKLYLKHLENQFLDAEATVYHSKVSNWLQWTPVTANFYVPLNLKEVWARGLEAKLKYQRTIGKVNISILGNYAYTLSTNQAIYFKGQEETMGKQLIFVPFHMMNGNMQLNYNKFTWSYSQSYTGLRYTVADNSRYIEPYFLAHVMVSRQIVFNQFTSYLQFRINNVWNVPYQSIPWWAMPGRAFYIALQVAFNNRT